MPPESLHASAPAGVNPQHPPPCPVPWLGVADYAPLCSPNRPNPWTISSRVAGSSHG